MKFALLGSDTASLRLVEAIATDDRHEVVAVYGAAMHQREIFDLAPHASFDTEWESLIHETSADAVIVATVSPWPDRDEALRKLFQAGLPLLVVHPACEAIVAFELEMIREDNRSIAVPYVPGQRCSAYRAALQLMGLTDSPLGNLTQVVLERTTPETGKGPLLRQLAGDMALMLPFLGNVRRVSAMSPDAGKETLANLTINMTGETGLLGRWSTSSMGNTVAAQLKLIGSNATATLTMPPEVSQWELVFSGDTETSIGQGDGSDAAAMLEDFEEAVAGASVQPTWMETGRASEVADTVEHSLRRGKTLELHHEEHSEESTFKGMMAAGGCFLLLITLMILVVGSVFEGVQRPLNYRPDAQETDAEDAVAEAKEPRRALWIRLWPAYPFALFLVLQLFRLVFLAPRQPATSPLPTPRKQR